MCIIIGWNIKMQEERFLMDYNYRCTPPLDKTPDAAVLY